MAGAIGVRLKATPWCMGRALLEDPPIIWRMRQARGRGGKGEFAGRYSRRVNGFGPGGRSRGELRSGAEAGNGARWWGYAHNGRVLIHSRIQKETKGPNAGFPVGVTAAESAGFRDWCHPELPARLVDFPPELCCFLRHLFSLESATRKFPDTPPPYLSVSAPGGGKGSAGVAPIPLAA